MPAVLTSSSVIACLHQGTVKAVPSQSKLLVDGKPALVKADLAAAAVAGCTNLPTPAAPSLKPCTTATGNRGDAMRLTVDGSPVLLDTAGGTTDSAPLATFSVTAAGQDKLTVR
jgi:hypothetical protein